MARKEEFTEQELVNFKDALEHIEELTHLMEKRPVETFKELMKLNFPMVLEIQIEGAAHILKLNNPD